MEVDYSFKDENFKVLSEHTFVCFSRVRSEHQGRYISYKLPDTLDEYQAVLYKDMAKFWKEWLVKPRMTFKTGCEITVDMQVHNYTTMLTIFTCFRHIFENREELLPVYIKLRRKRISKLTALRLAEQVIYINNNHGLTAYACIGSKKELTKFINIDVPKQLCYMLWFDDTAIADIDMQSYNTKGKGLCVHKTWSVGLADNWYNKFKFTEAICKKYNLDL
jgi:hypothetical protein